MSRRRRRAEPPPWRFNWRNEEMDVLRRPFVQTALGNWEKRETIMTPDQSTELAQESFANMNDYPSQFPDWRTDPTYNMHRKGGRKR